MITRLFLPTAAVLLSSVSSVTAASSSGVNLCAAYDIVVPMITDGEEACKCAGRTIVCDFEDICEGTDCADLGMTIDFSDSGEETIFYDVTYGADVAAGTSATVRLHVASKVEAGIEECEATLGNPDETTSNCMCTPCEGGSGVVISCNGGSVSTNGCFKVDVSKFERFVPFLGGDGGTIIARATELQQEGAASAAVTSSAAGTTALLAATAAAMVL
ncbi:expressed unknown protein [Seminavis robusta]|uniref:Uncharacterized protein n=1 Tax=Seminavis robusta TaxID=568900 RepID=A0A9N8DRA5_9STRA|nr:expressed unknown protein [Seminavis robusta]|eukprot:Sro299_g111390.1 n/a (217) ;mRNA; r:42644-43294